MSDITVTRYSVPLRSGTRLGAERLDHREGLLIAWRDPETGLTGRGEAAPAWWLGEAPVATVAGELAALVNTRTAANLGDALDAGTLDASAPVRCALETALLDLRGRQCGRTVAALLGAPEPAAESFDVAALIAGDGPEEIRAEASRRLQAGFRVLKLKVGGRTPATDIARIEALREGGDGRVLLRLDANRCWREEEAAEVLAAIAAPDIEYVEEPLRTHDLVALARLHARAGVPIAMDESVTTVEHVTRLAECGVCDTIVIKLARVGGPRAAVALAQHARSLGIRVALTDSIETAVGRAAAVHVAAALPGPHQAIGLGGALLLATDPLTGEAGEPTAHAVASGPGLGVA
jgi:o-succinylbenzoate synthase